MCNCYVNIVKTYQHSIASKKSSINLLIQNLVPIKDYLAVTITSTLYICWLHKGWGMNDYLILLNECYIHLISKSDTQQVFQVKL